MSGEPSAPLSSLAQPLPEGANADDRPSLTQQEDQMNGVVMCLARFAAKNIVKQDWRDQGRKLSEIEARDLISFANAYL
jgi:hypothetical protein